jgi:hypothetical protein
MSRAMWITHYLPVCVVDIRHMTQNNVMMLRGYDCSV